MEFSTERREQDPITNIAKRANVNLNIYLETIINKIKLDFKN